MAYQSKKRFAVMLVCAGYFGVCSGSAFAADADAIASDGKPVNPARWIVTVGASVEYGSKFEGARSNGFGFMPSFDIRRGDEPEDMSAPDDNIDYTLVTLGGLELGPVVGFRSGRDHSDDRAFVGLRHISWTVDGGMFAQYWPIQDRLRVRAEVRQAFNNSGGLVADLSADVFQRYDKFLFSVGPRLSIADSTYMRNAFGVTEDEARNNHRVEPYTPGGGIKSYGIVAATTYTFSDAWSVQVFGRYDRLAGDAAESPIVPRLGSKDQSAVGITWNYSFGVGH
ncbi:MipA/OmpV family protein [Phyllobacterium myrsinacearum]|uniref:Outer membrane scaffolding protein for murein synthesis (MipA/OmpV family) n=1 Tax=Phyllobacterium myrsinacearum TaxID=28101 RepID=A0A839EB92_9HYPH|nr:MipA/OmpV family protein [Phyllobacterium myrsinacearum]MBA8877151.1 outer membrane scaffolding protein for murein synthesis (MipA/OmpV family) [Phyllobacterium myrsinacearum]